MICLQVLIHGNLLYKLRPQQSESFTKKGVPLEEMKQSDGIENTAITFTPVEYSTEVELNARGDTMSLDAKGFGTLTDASPVTGKFTLF